jgi:3'(2'),5'-bisphosphate nucleotidase
MTTTSAALVEIALEAGREIMAVYADTFIEATVKGDGSPVTLADQRAERVILDGLAAAFPGVPVVAEEEVTAGRIPASAARFFLVDPLDGTREFLGRNGEFTVNIALVEHGVPVAGVVFAPALGQLYVADGGTAWRADVQAGRCGEFIAISARPAPARIAATTSRSHAGDDTDTVLGRFDVQRREPRGSSLKFCLIADGQADLYVRKGRTMEWDTAAGDAILRSAGGTTVGLDGAPLVYGRRWTAAGADFANPDFLAVGDRTLRQRDGVPVVSAA